ncbi:MAG TPA: glycosyltransferase family 2 protein, partial [Longimicrobiales bacterium]|nr:glycosyltransferase family 2 protein [Longimicrobiales bacterium]
MSSRDLAPRTTDAPADVEISVIVPVFNEALNIDDLYARLVPVVPEPAEFIFIDDGSTDGTAGRLRAIAATDARVRVVRFRRNFGQTAALSAGIDHAAGDIIIPMDGDLQNDPADIPQMLAHAVQGDYDVVTGIRQKRKDSLVKKIPSKIANFMVRRVTNLDIKDNGCALKVFTKEIAKDLNLYGEMHRFITLLAHLEGGRIKQVPVKHHARNAGVSKYGLERVFKVVADMMLL